MRREDLDDSNPFEDDRDEAKEDIYDYFMDGQQMPAPSDENADGRVDYHVMDDGQQMSEGDEEMLDEDEIKARNANMLKELYDKIQQEEGDD